MFTIESDKKRNGNLLSLSPRLSANTTLRIKYIDKKGN